MPLLGNVVISKKIPMHTQDHGDGIATRRESVRPCTLVDHKQKRYDNTVDVVVRLHSPTDQAPKLRTSEF